MDCISNRNYLVDPNHFALVPQGSSQACSDGYRQSNAVRRVFATVTMNLYAHQYGDFIDKHIESRWRFFTDLPFLQTDLIWNVVCSAIWGVAALFTAFQNETVNLNAKRHLYEVKLAIGSIGDALYGILSPQGVSRGFISDYRAGCKRLNQVKQAGRGSTIPVSVDANHTALATIRDPYQKQLSMRYSDTLRSTFAIAEQNQYDYQETGGWFNKKIVTRLRFAENVGLSYVRISLLANKIFFLTILAFMTLFLVDSIKNRVFRCTSELSTLGTCIGDSLIGVVCPKRVTARFIDDFYSGAGRLAQIRAAQISN